MIRGDTYFGDLDELLWTKRNPERARAIEQTSAAAAEGIMLEDEARRSFERNLEVKVEPMCLERIDRPYMRCSVDGISLETRTLVEIKCGLKNYEGILKYKAIPRWYYTQLQHILAVTGFEEINFYSYRPGREPLNIVCQRQDWFVRQLERLEKKFWDLI